MYFEKVTWLSEQPSFMSFFGMERILSMSSGQRKKGKLLTLIARKCLSIRKSR